MVTRKIIFKCKTGSHLYGTSRPESDLDFQGVFLPSTEDLLSLDKCPDEWTENVKISEGPRNSSGDIDCKYFSLQKFLRLAAQGQPGQLEMLFAPTSVIEVATSEWDEIVTNRDLFLSKKGITPFIGFAIAQMHKATIKGENLNLIETLLEWGKTLTNTQLNDKLKNNFACYNDSATAWLEDKELTGGKQIILNYFINEVGAPQISVAGRNFDAGSKTKNFLDSMKTLEERYGTRVRSAALEGYDYKSLGHAVRLLGQAEEFLETGKITLPRPDAEYLKTILRGTIDDSAIDWYEVLNAKINYLKQDVQPKSYLQDEPNWKRINQLCLRLLLKHLST